MVETFSPKEKDLLRALARGERGIGALSERYGVPFRRAADLIHAHQHRTSKPERAGAERRTLGSIEAGERSPAVLAKLGLPLGRIQEVLAEAPPVVKADEPNSKPAPAREPRLQPLVTRPGREFGLTGAWEDRPLTQRAANTLIKWGLPSDAEIAVMLRERRPGDARFEGVGPQAIALISQAVADTTAAIANTEAPLSPLPKEAEPFSDKVFGRVYMTVALGRPARRPWSKPHVAEEQLPATQEAYLLLIAAQAEHGLALPDDMTHMPELSEALNGLCSQGLVERVRPQGRGLTARCVLTRAGWALWSSLVNTEMGIPA
jgi:hypothetical protein